MQVLKRLGKGSGTPQSSSSIFGSLRRTNGATTSGPKSQSLAKNPNFRKPKQELGYLGKTKSSEKREKTTTWFSNNNSSSKNNNLNTVSEQIKSSAVSLVSLRVQQKTKNVPKPKRPVSVPEVSNVTLRRGQNKEGQGQQDNLSRTSSVTNLDVSDQHKIQNKGAKPRKVSSKEKIDKVADRDRRNDAKKGITKNNNKLDSGESLDSLHEEEFLQLRRQLQDMANEKSSLALQLGEQKGQLTILQNEIQKLKSFQEDSIMELEKLTDENTALRNRLRDVAHSPLSDNEKQQLLFESQRHHSSAPASIATNLLEDGNGGDVTACTTPDWDKHSSGNISEVSVACLQDKINQMQETHYSTNEELQATLQELTDLQRQLTELQQENERLNEEKTLMFDSLCRQTERLNDSRQEVENLKQLFYREKDENGQYETAVEREQKLVDLLKSAQEERETLLVKLEQISSELQESRQGNLEKGEDIIQLAERVKTLECTLDAKHAEHKQLDQELAIAKDQCSGKQIEINRLTDLLENARTKIMELEQDRKLSDKSELDELLDNARKEKDQLESEVAHLKEQLARSKNETEKLKEQVSILQEECKVTRNNAKTTQSDLEYKCEKLLMEKNGLTEQLQQFQEAVNELQVQSQCQLEDKRQLSAVLSETQRNLSEAERKNLGLESEIQELKKLRAEENDEWEKFQNDLLTSVRVANDFKTEAQQELQKIILENKTYRERVRLLESQIEKHKGVASKEELLSYTVDDIEKTSVSSPRSSGQSRTSSKDNKGSEKFTKERKLSFEKNKKSISMESLFKLSQRKNKEIDLPRKSKDSLESTSSSNKSEKNPFGRLVKKREKKPPNRTSKRKNLKTLSIEEELLLKSLDDWYDHIDQSIPEENLSVEEKAIKQLKTLYEDDHLKEKPVANKPKEQLAISKPLLNSVLLNPNLQQIVKDPNIRTLEGKPEPRIILPGEENEMIEIRNSFRLRDDKLFRVQSQDFTRMTSFGSKIPKSKSLDDLNIFEEPRTGSEVPVLYRTTEAENLLTVENIPVRDTTDRNRFSDILPSDSVSNPRYSSKYYEQRENQILPKPNVYVNYESLDNIIHSIPKNVPDSRLTKEQKFALKLKKALDDAEKKNTLKKMKKVKKNVEISYPIKASVEKNWKLKEILSNPNIKDVKNENVEKSKFYLSDFLTIDRRHSTGSDMCDNVEERAKERRSGYLKATSKSYDDITFVFNPNCNLSYVSENFSVKDQIPKSFSSSSSDVSLTSGEFNVVTGRITPSCSIRINDLKKPTKENASYLSNDKKGSEQDQKISDGVVEDVPDSVDLFYNETSIKNKFNTQIKKSFPTDKEPDFSDTDLEDVLYKDTLKTYRRSLRKLTKDMEYLDKVQSIKKEKDTLSLKDVNSENTSVTSQVELLRSNKEIYSPTEICNVYNVTEVKNIDYQYLTVEGFEATSLSRHNEDNITAQRDRRPASEKNNDEDIIHHLLHSANGDDTNENRFRTLSQEIKDNQDTPEFSSINSNVSEKLSPSCINSRQSDAVIETKNPFKSFAENQQTQNVPEEGESSGTYSYSQIMKENKYGIECPIELRYTYKNVVKEIKNRFSQTGESIPKEEEPDDFVDHNPNFFDDFFGIRRASPRKLDTIEGDIVVKDAVPSEVSENVEDNISIIDQEMQEILEKYLHTRASIIVKKTGVDHTQVKEQNVLETENHKIALKRYDPVENIHEAVDYYDKQNEDTQKFLEHESLKNVETKYVANNPFIVDKEGVKIVEMPVDDNPIDEEENGYLVKDDFDVDRMSVSTAIDKTNEENEEQDILPDLIPPPKLFTDEDLENKYQNLTGAELDIIRAATRDRFSRPLSDITEKDLLMIEEISNRYLNEDNESIPTENIHLSVVIEAPIEEVESRNVSRIKEGEINKEALLTKEIYISDDKFIRNTSTTSSMPRLHSISTEKRRQIKSWTEELNRTSLNASVMSYEPVYANVESLLNLNSPKTYTSVKVEKKPLPIPRHRSNTDISCKNAQGGKNITMSGSDSVKGENVIDLGKMTDSSENFSVDGENKDSGEVLESSKADIVVKSDDEPLKDFESIPEQNLNSKIEEYAVKVSISTVEVIASPQNTQNHENESEKEVKFDGIPSLISPCPSSTNGNLRTMEDDDKLSEEACGTDPSINSISAIAVASKLEQLDLTKRLTDEDVEEISRASTQDDSNVNLFDLDASSCDEAYIDMFRTNEEKVYDKLRRRRPHLSGFVYVEALSDDSSSDIMKPRLPEGEETVLETTDEESKPKIVDFVPLDDKTDAVFTKVNQEPLTTSKSYDTLEREKVFHVLNVASNLDIKKKPSQDTSTEEVKKDDVLNYLEVLAKKSSSFSSSKSQTSTSFTQAKRIFEALVEANIDTSAVKDSSSMIKLSRDKNLLVRNKNIEDPVNVDEEK